MWTLDKIVIVAGVLIAFLTALAPVIVALINRSPEKKKKTPEVIQGEPLDLAQDYLAFLKAEVERLLDQIANLEMKIEVKDETIYSQDLENDMLREALNLADIPIPKVHPQNKETHRYERDT